MKSKFAVLCMLAVVGIGAFGLAAAQEDVGGSPSRDSVPIKFTDLQVLSDLPAGLWRLVSTSSMNGRNGSGEADERLANREEMACVSQDEIKEILTGFRPNGCPFTVSKDFGNEAQVAISCPGATIMGTEIPGFTFPVKITRPTTSENRVFEVRERAPKGDKFIRSELTYFGKCAKE